MPPRRLTATAVENDRTGSETLTLVDTAYRDLRRDIIGGVFAPGQPLRLEGLRARYGLSFSPLREALNRLQSERLVQSAPLRGFSVAPFSAAQMWDAVETRVLVECEALRRAIAAGDDAWEARIVAAFHALNLKTKRLATRTTPPTAEEAQEIETSHYEFHRALIDVCGSPRLLDLADKLYAETERYRQPTLTGRTPKGTPRDVALEHREIMDATLAREEARAIELLAAHYRRTATLVEASLDAK